MWSGLCQQGGPVTRELNRLFSGIGPGVYELEQVYSCKDPDNAGDVRDMDSIPGSRRSPGGGHGKPLHYSCLENPHGQRSLEDYSPKGRKDSDTTEAT